MLKIGIKDPTVRIKPGKRLVDYLKTLTHEKCIPKNVKTVIGKKTGKTFEEEIAPILTSKREEEILKNLKTDTEAVEAALPDDTETSRDGDLLEIYDLKWLYNVLNEKRESTKGPYLHELLEGSDVVLPANEYQERNPELEARCVQLRKEQEQRIYDKMTNNVGTTRKPNSEEESIGAQIKMMNRHLIAIAQFIFSVAAGFAFGFIGIELLVGELDFGFRLLLGVAISIIIALAEIYFLAKRLSEEFEEPPPKKVPASPTRQEKKVQ